MKLKEWVSQVNREKIRIWYNKCYRRMGTQGAIGDSGYEM